MKLRSVLALVAVCALSALPAQAGAFSPTASFTATDYHWGDSTTGATTVHIDPGGTVSFAYPSGGSTHDADFGATPPTNCSPSLPTTPTAPGWSSSCEFDTAGTYTFFCDLHSSMRATVLVGDVPDPPIGGGGSAGGGGGSGGGGGAGGQTTGSTLGGVKLARTQHGTRVVGSVAGVAAGDSLTVTLTYKGKKVGRLVKNGLAAGTASFKVGLTSSGRKLLKKRHKLAVKVSIALKTDTAALSATRSVTIKRP